MTAASHLDTGTLHIKRAVQTEFATHQPVPAAPVATWAPPQPEVRYVFVAQQPKPLQSTNHILHLILTLITCGFWAPIWLLVAINIGVNNGLIRRQNAALMRAALGGRS